MGFNLGGLLKIVAPLALTAITGGAAAPMLSVAMKQIASQVAMSVIQKIGQQMGVPMSAIGLAQAAFGAASGQPELVQRSLNDTVNGLADEFRFSPVQSGILQRAASTYESNLEKILMDRIRSSASDEVKDLRFSGGKGQSLLMKIAIALGKLLDAKMTEMAGLTEQIGQQGTQNANDLRGFGKITEKNTARFEAAKTEGQSKLGELTGRLQGLGQEVSMLSNALSNTIKSIGEANTTLARKG